MLRKGQLRAVAQALQGCDPSTTLSAIYRLRTDQNSYYYSHLSLRRLRSTGPCSSLGARVFAKQSWFFPCLAGGWGATQHWPRASQTKGKVAIDCFLNNCQTLPQGKEDGRVKWESWREEARDPPSPRDWQRPRQGHFQAGAGSSPRDTPAQGWQERKGRLQNPVCGSLTAESCS